MIESLLSVDFLKFFLPIAGAVIAWYLNEVRKRSWEEYKRKEERYQGLLSALTGFYAHSSNPETRAKFIDEYKKCWLYCDDKVIHAVNQAMEGMIEETTMPMEKRLEAIGSLVVAIRQDLLKRKVVDKTALTHSDYVHISPGE